MNPLEELQVLINVARAHNEQHIYISVDVLEFLLVGYENLNGRLVSLEQDVAILTDSGNYAKGM